jgi:hypothetical protein
MITRLEIHPKAGETVPLAFHVRQNHPYPDIEGHSGWFKWRNGEGLFDAYNKPAKGLKAEYTANLLVEGFAGTEPKDRTEYAGYEGRPGSFKYRGKDIGELSIVLDRSTNWPSQTVRVRGFETPTASERTFIVENIVPSLVADIAAHKSELYREAVAKVRERFEMEIMDMRGEVNKLEREAAVAVKKLEAFRKA